MTRSDRYILGAVIVAFILAALWVGWAYAQTGLVVPGDLDIGDDLGVSDNLQVHGDTNTDGLTTMSHHSSSYLPQRTLITFSEAAFGGKAFPDTICGMSKRIYFIAPCAGLIYDVYFGIAGIGSGWDSLKVDVWAGVGADTSVFTTVPMLTPADGADADTKNAGRSAVMSSTMRIVASGERVEVSAATYGSCVDGPTGLFVYAWFQPNYGN